MDTGLSLPRYPLLVLLCAVCALSGTRSPVAAAGRSCADTRQVYAEKGYGTGTAPLTQISGNTLLFNLLDRLYIRIKLIQAYYYYYNIIIIIIKLKCVW